MTTQTPPETSSHSENSTTATAAATTIIDAQADEIDPDQADQIASSDPDIAAAKRSFPGRRRDALISLISLALFLTIGASLWYWLAPNTTMITTIPAGSSAAIAPASAELAATPMAPIKTTPAQSAPELAAIEVALRQIGNNVAALQSLPAQLDERLGVLEKIITNRPALPATADIASGTDDRIRRNLAITELLWALETGRPFAIALGDADRFAPPPPITPPLRRFAASGVPTIAALRIAFKDLIPSLITTVNPTISRPATDTPETGLNLFTATIQRQVERFISIEKIATESPPQTSQQSRTLVPHWITIAQQALDRHNLDLAITILTNNKSTNTALDAWLHNAHARRDVSALIGQAIRQPSATSMLGAKTNSLDNPK